MRISLPNVNKFSNVKVQKDKEGYSLLTIRVNIRIYDRQCLNQLLVLRNNDLFLDFLEDIRLRKPDLITLQGIERGNENGISIEGYESVYFCPFGRSIGYATFWKPSKFSLINRVNVDYFVNELKNSKENTPGGLITSFSTHKDEKLCVVNTELNNLEEMTLYQGCVLLTFLKEIFEQGSTLLITGVQQDWKPLFTRPFTAKFWKSLKPFLKNQKLTVFLNEKAKPPINSENLCEFSEHCLHPFQVFYKGRLQVSESNLVKDDGLSVVFNLN